MKTVLVVASHFPPNPTGGVVRVSKMAKYLPHSGWKPVVLTSCARQDVGLCAGLIADVDHARVVRAPACDLRRIYAILKFWTTTSGSLALASAQGKARPSFGARWLVPDHMLAGAIPTLPVGVLMAATTWARVVYATGPCHSALLAGACIARIAWIPLVAELGDQ